MSEDVRAVGEYILVPKYNRMIQAKTAYLCKTRLEIIQPSFTNVGLTMVSFDFFRRRGSLTSRKLVSLLGLHGSYRTPTKVV